MNNLLCPWESPFLLFFSSDPGVPNLLYYAYIPLIILALFFAIYVFIKSNRSVLSTILLILALIFSFWLLNEIIQWTENRLIVQMFSWQLIRFFEVSIFLMTAFFCVYFFKKGSVNFRMNLFMSLLLLPVLILLPTTLNIGSFYLSSVDCGGNYGPLFWYVYFVQIVSFFIILFSSISNYKKETDKNYRKQILIVAIGAISFLVIMFFVSIFSDLTLTYEINLIGPIGMALFISLLAFMIVRFNSFKIKLLATQALIWGLIVLIGSQFFFIQTTTNFILTGITFVGIIVAGRFLIISVRREVMQREQLQILTEQLFEANDKLKSLDKLKTEFVSLASHQLRSPLTAIKGYASMLVEGDYGEIKGETKEAVGRIFQSCQNLTRVVEDLLDVTKIEQGGMKFVMEPFNLVEIARDMAKDLSITAEGKGLKLNFSSTDDVCMVNGDKEKIRQVVLNFIDNSIKYTKVGEVNVSVKKTEDKALFSVKDTGVGMTEAIKATLFQKFVRGDGGQMNTTGSGLGLYLAKEIVEAHNGRVWVDSEGVNKGSEFNMELDIVK